MADNDKLPPRPKRIPPHILRRRRIVAVVLLVVILALIGWGISALVGQFLPDDDSPEPEATVAESAQPSPSEPKNETSPAPSEQASDDVAACESDVLAVSGATDQESYAEDEQPKFTMTISHEGDELCDASVGSDEQSFVVEDADGDFVFSTRACQVDPQSQVVEMEPGQSESVDYKWERIGTDEQCETMVEDIEPGQYQLVVGLGEQTAEPVAFELK